MLTSPLACANVHNLMTLYQTFKAVLKTLMSAAHLGWLSLWSDPMASNFFIKLAPYLAATGQSLINLDEDSVGADDVVGSVLLYGAEVIVSVNNGDADLPPFPDSIAGAIVGKVTGPARTAIIIASGPLTIAEFQLAGTHPKASKALHYANQVLTAISAGKPVPAAPVF